MAPTSFFAWFLSGQRIRQTDTIAGLGGNEFAVLFPEMPEAPAAAMLEKLRSSLNAAMQQHKWAVTFSIGAVIFQPPESVQESHRRR